MRGRLQRVAQDDVLKRDLALKPDGRHGGRPSSCGTTRLSRMGGGAGSVPTVCASAFSAESKLETGDWSRGALTPSGRNRHRNCYLTASIILVLGLMVNLSPARTLVLEGQEIDLAAGMAADAPRMGWAMSLLRPGIYTTALLDLMPGRSFLFRFPLDRIPAGQRITQAELILPVDAVEGTDPRLYLWRVAAEWGVGACYDFRMTVPQKVAWTRPGAGGRFADRAGRPTVVARLIAPGQKVFNVTEDVELWQAGSATNWGWLLTVEDPGIRIQMASPLGNGERQWKLRITHEPQ